MRQGIRTAAFPPRGAQLPERFRGRPVLDPSRCTAACRECALRAPSGAIGVREDGAPELDLGACLFSPEVELAHALDERSRRLFGRSLKLRSVVAGSCNGCEAELVALGNVVFDLGRFGVQFVASPRHADGIVVTGAINTNMRLALEKTYEAVPPPKLVIAVGACAIRRGPFAG